MSSQYLLHSMGSPSALRITFRAEMTSRTRAASSSGHKAIDRQIWTDFRWKAPPRKGEQQDLLRISTIRCLSRLTLRNSSHSGSSPLYGITGVGLDHPRGMKMEFPLNKGKLLEDNSVWSSPIFWGRTASTVLPCGEVSSSSCFMGSSFLSSPDLIKYGCNFHETAKTDPIHRTLPTFLQSLS